MTLTKEQIEALLVERARQAVEAILAELRAERDAAARGRDSWRDDFKALAAAIVGDTGLSAMAVAAQARTFRPRAEAAEAERDRLAAENAELRAERDAFKGNADDAYAKWAEEKDRADAAEAMLEGLRAERDALATTVQGLRAATTRIMTGQGAVIPEWQDKLDAAEAMMAELRARITSLSQQVDTIAAHRDEVVTDRDRLAAENAELRAERDRINQWRETAIVERDTYSEERDRLAAENAELRGKLQAMHRRAQRAEGKSLRSIALLDVILAKIKDALPALPTLPSPYPISMHTLFHQLHAVRRHAKNGSRAALGVQFSYYYDRLKQLWAERDALRADRDRLADANAALEAKVAGLVDMIEVAARARLIIDTAFNEMGETINYAPAVIARVCNMLEPHSALAAAQPQAKECGNE